MAVSSTSVRGFKLREGVFGNLMGTAIIKFIMNNSGTFTIGDFVRVNTSGLLTRCAAGDGAGVGIIQGFTDQNGLNLFSPRVTPQSIAGTTLTPGDTVAVASDNSSNSVKQLKAEVLVDPSGSLLFFNNANNTGLATSNLLQYYNVLTSNPGQIDTATNSNTNGQFQLVGLDPDNDAVTSKGLFRIAQNQLTTNFPSYGSTAVRAA